MLWDSPHGHFGVRTESLWGTNHFRLKGKHFICGQKKGFVQPSPKHFLFLQGLTETHHSREDHVAQHSFCSLQLWVRETSPPAKGTRFLFPREGLIHPAFETVDIFEFLWHLPLTGGSDLHACFFPIIRLNTQTLKATFLMCASKAGEWSMLLGCSFRWGNGHTETATASPVRNIHNPCCLLKAGNS